MGFYVDVMDWSNNNYVFYANLNKAISKGLNINVEKIIGQKNVATVKDFASKYFGSDYATMMIFNPDTGQLEDTEMHMAMQGISVGVSKELAEEILTLAKYYCPVDTGYLRDSGRIEEQPDGSFRIVFDCPYAWYVHEFSWKQHDYPTCDHFLTRAIYEVQKEHGYGWY
jgi:hypothetical protein